MSRLTLAALTVSAALLSGCASLWGPNASATLIDPQGQAAGTVSFTPTAEGTQVSVRVSGLTPGQHGMHIHENPSCANTTDAAGVVTVFGGAGGHFDPWVTKNHDSPTTENTRGHTGDLPMITVGVDGTGSADFVTRKITLTRTDSVIGRSLVIHAAPDDYATDPAGNSGARERCGVITAAQSPGL